jgi:hypothetical protein
MIASANRGETLKMEVARPLKQSYLSKCVLSHLRPVIS